MSKISPVQVRFGESGKGVTAVFPTNTSSAELAELITACEPAPFGRGGKEVFDEEYRQAGKLDTTAFATSFCPYQAGIIDVVTQLLVPQIEHDKHMRSIKVCKFVTVSMSMYLPKN